MISSRPGFVSILCYPGQLWVPPSLLSSGCHKVFLGVAGTDREAIPTSTTVAMVMNVQSGSTLPQTS